MNSYSYYYLDGVERRGPFSEEELIAKKLPPTTLIYFDSISTWKPLSQFENLIQQTALSHSSENNHHSDKIANNSNNLHSKRKIKIPFFAICIVFLVFSTLSSYFYSKSRKSTDLMSIREKIDNVFQNKDEICDYDYETIDGKLKQVNDFTPKDNEDNRLTDYYQCDIGGWTVLTLKKNSDQFKITESTSSNMGFKVPVSYYTQGRDYGYGVTTEGYDVPTHRGTVQNAYKEAMHHISIESENKSYVPGSYSKINDFINIQTEFYCIVKSFESFSTASVFNRKWIVWYNIKDRHFFISEKTNKFNEYWMINSIISGSIGIILLFIIRYRKQITFQIT